MLFFKTKKINAHNNIGQLLKEARAKTGLSLKIISKHLSISVKYLEALENNKLSQIPGPIYIKNFLKKYSEYLGVDLNYFNIHPANKENNIFHYKTEKKFFINFPSVIKKTSLVFIILILFIYILKQINLITTPPKIIINYPPDNLIIYDNFLIINGQTEPEVKIKINQEDILLQSDQTFQQKINLLPGINSIIIEGKKKYSSATTLEKKIIYQTEKK
ncbi:MAG TPA: helix-turn-helix transcriptional regulator [bacterium]|nr:helix-turn-helix transcriptional regulator [bacterium]HPL95702.1 helix-turn-helix transcriptional regulator [bacterium]